MQVSVENATGSLGERNKRLLRGRFPAHTAKQAARITGADLRAARAWVEEGKAPSERHLRAIVRELGEGAIAALFGPELEDHDEQKIMREIHELREEASRLEARIRKSGAPSAHQLDDLAFAETCSQRVNQSGDRRCAGGDRRKGGRRASDR